MNYNLKNIERETIYNFNEEEKTATIYTCNKSLIRKMDGLCKNYPNDCKIENQDEHSKTFIVPKKWIKPPRPPRQISEEQKEILILRMRQLQDNK